MDIFFYNTLTKKKELFKSLEPKKVKMYSCGPTVYKDATIGNMRTNLFQDTLRRVLEYNGYEVKQVMNITDVGHLVSDVKVSKRRAQDSDGNSRVLYKIVF